ncbi:MAG: SdpI family protein [Caulobacterales bacterium]|nr:SdpI family protein [Caulobacterales bacterium]
MTRRFTLIDIATAVAVAALLAGALWVVLHGPTEPLPMHFGADGRPDRWGDRRELAGLLAFLAVIVGLTAGGLGVYAGRATDPARRRGLRLGQLVSLIVIGSIAPFLTWQILSTASQPAAAPAIVTLVWPMGFLAFVCLTLGAVLGRIPPNIAIGVRTAWSLKSRLAWDRSNRLMGRLLFWLGLGGLVATPAAPQPLGLWVMVAGILLSGVAAIFESWRVWRTDSNRQPF